MPRRFERLRSASLHAEKERIEEEKRLAEETARLEEEARLQEEQEERLRQAQAAC